MIVRFLKWFTVNEVQRQKVVSSPTVAGKDISLPATFSKRVQQQAVFF